MNPNLKIFFSRNNLQKAIKDGVHLVNLDE